MILEPDSTGPCLRELRSMPAFLRGAVMRFPGESALTAAPDGSFCFLEQVWHLADLEVEAFALRIVRILREDDPVLGDFDGARVARERQYRGLSLAEGLERFATARAGNLELLSGLEPSQWGRPASQEGVGRLVLADVPRLMAEHDASHRAEILALLGEAPPSADNPRVA